MKNSPKLKIVKKTIAILIGIICLLSALAFLVTYEENLHCSQYTSFTIAAFDMDPHPEEFVDGRKFIGVYHHITGIPLRVYLSLLVLGLLLWPGIAVFLAVKERLKFSTFILGLLSLAGLLLLTGIPISIAGERFQALAIRSLLLGGLLSGLAGLGIILMKFPKTNMDQ